MEFYLAGISIGLGLTLFVHTRNENKKNDLRLKYTKEQEQKEQTKQTIKPTNNESTSKCDLRNNPYFEEYKKSRSK